MEESSSAKTSMLVVHDRSLGFDLLLEIYAIKMLGGIGIGPSGQIQISDGRVVKCAAITLNEHCHLRLSELSLDCSVEVVRGQCA